MTDQPGSLTSSVPHKLRAPRMALLAALSAVQG